MTKNASHETVMLLGIIQNQNPSENPRENGGIADAAALLHHFHPTSSRLRARVVPCQP